MHSFIDNKECQKINLNRVARNEFMVAQVWKSVYDVNVRNYWSKIDENIGKTCSYGIAITFKNRGLRVLVLYVFFDKINSFLQLNCCAIFLFCIIVSISYGSAKIDFICMFLLQILEIWRFVIFLQVGAADW